MAKLLKILLRFIGVSFEWILICLIIAAFAIRTSPFQTFLAQKATVFLSKELNTRISVEKVDIIFFDKLALDGIFILDKSKDTLADLKSIFVTLKSFNSIKNIIVIKELNLKQGNIKINRAKKTGEFNFQFIADYFASTDTTASKPLEVDLRKIKLTQVDFKYDDNRYEKIPFGMDYNHLKLNNLFLTTTKFKLLKSGGIDAYIKHLSFSERSGLKITSFSSRIAFDDLGLRMKYFRMVTDKSKINFDHLNLNITSQDDFSEFVDKVEFDINLRKSIISLEDVSIFVPDLEGMNDKILIEAKISKRVKDLIISDLDLRIGKNTMLKGSFTLPDFRDLEKSFFNEQIQYAYIDLDDIEKIKLPKSSSEKYIKLDEGIRKLNVIKIEDFRIDGKYSKFTVKANKIITDLGSLKMNHGIVFKEHKERNSFTFEKDVASKYDVKIDSFLLGEFISNKDIGSLTGEFFLEGEIFSNGKFDLNLIEGKIKHLDYLNYPYKNITLTKSSFKNNVFQGKMDIEDGNLNLTYHGLLDFNTKQHFQFDIDISEAKLDKLGLSKIDGNELKSAFKVDISGTNLNNYSGTINLHGLYYKEGDKKVTLPVMDFKMSRNETNDVLSIISPVGNIAIEGKIDYNTIADDLNNQFSVILPAIFKEKPIKKSYKKSKFKYEIILKKTDEVLALFAPNLKIAEGTRIEGFFDGFTKEFDLNVTSNLITYNNIVLTNLLVTQHVDERDLHANYTVSKFSLNDSTFVSNASFKALGSKGEINSELRWNPGEDNESYFSWKTVINDVNSYFFNLNPSYFTIRHHRWEIVDNSQIFLAPNDIQIQNFKMQRNNQYLAIDGRISKENKDVLKLVINDLELEDFATLLNLPTQLKGELNGTASISDPFNNVSFTSDVAIRDLFVDGAEVGDVNLKGSWGIATKSVDLKGELFYKKAKTFSFDGKYFTEKVKDNIDFNFNFDYTDIQFANAFMDPKVVSGLRGLIDGELKLTGSLDEPIVEGSINLLGGNAKVEMFGVNFGFSGKIDTDKYGMYIDNMPIMDEEGNTGALVGTVFHDNFKNWNMDLFFNLRDDAYAMQNGVHNQELSQFLVMDTKYKEGDIYYGKAYATGTAEIFGYADNLEIDVDLKTRRDTKINFPMYGTSEIQEGKFIQFKSDLVKDSVEKQKIDLTGVSMKLNFNVTNDAQLKIIFDESLGDEITAFGSGDFTIEINNLGDVEMNGVYTIGDKSVYNFVMPPVKEQFKIKKGGTITWTGDPVEAELNLETYITVVTSLAEIMPNIEQTNSKTLKEVECYLNLTKKLSEPLITFDIIVRNANENDNAAINRIKADKDELNKQFFSLLLVKKFQPIHGQSSAGSGAALQLVSGQLEDMLNNISNDVRINVALRNENNGPKEATFGLEKSLLNDKLVVKTNLGVENSAGNTSQGSFVGDVNVEYLINAEGTFRVSIFNESNDNTVIQEKNLGPFTQGVGLNYQEQFNSAQDFKMWQYFLDLFRKTKKYPIKKHKRQKPVPPLGSPGIKEEEIK